MEKTNLENLNVPRPNGTGKMDTNLSALADSLQFLSLGVPGVSRSKKFNVNAWSTPLKSIENQQRRVAREKLDEIESVVGEDDSLSNLSDLFPGQNVFEKTCDLIEYYGVNSPIPSVCTPIGDRTASFVALTRSPVADHRLSVSLSSPSNSYSAPKSDSFCEASADLPDLTDDHSSPLRSSEGLCEVLADDDASDRASTPDDESFYLAVSQVLENSVIDSPTPKNESLDSANVDSLLDIVGSSTALDVECAECGSDVDDNEESSATAESGASSPIASKTAYEAVECGHRVSSPLVSSHDSTSNEEASLSPPASVKSFKDHTRLSEGEVSTESRSYEIDASVVHCDLVEVDSEDSTAPLVAVPPIDPILEYCSPSVATANVSADLSEYVSVIPSQHPTEEERSECTDNGCSFVHVFPQLADSSSNEQNECSTENEMEYDCDSPIKVSLEETIVISTTPSKNDSYLSTISSTPPSNSHNDSCMDVIDEPLEVCLKTYSPHVVVDAVSTDEPVSSLQQYKELNSTLQTPSKPIDQEQHLESEELNYTLQTPTKPVDQEQNFESDEVNSTLQTQTKPVGQEQNLEFKEVNSTLQTPIKLVDQIQELQYEELNSTLQTPSILVNQEKNFESEEVNSTLQTPIKPVDQEQNLESDEVNSTLQTPSILVNQEKNFESEEGNSTLQTPIEPVDQEQNLESDEVNSMLQTPTKPVDQEQSVESEELNSTLQTPSIPVDQEQNLESEEVNFTLQTPIKLVDQIQELQSEELNSTLQTPSIPVDQVDQEQNLEFEEVNSTLQTPTKLVDHEQNLESEELNSTLQVSPKPVIQVQELQSEGMNSMLQTPIKPVDQEQNMKSDKLVRVCNTMNEFMSLFTPMKDLRTNSRTPINPFRCENVGNEKQKIVLDFPTSLLDVSIGMLESMTAMIAPVESASNVTHLDEQNVASDLINVAQTPLVIRTQSDQLSSTIQPNASIINKRLLEENANLKIELEEYKRKHDILQEEYESLIKTAHALYSNETTLKKALHEYEDETRKACNKYLILKEYANTLIISLNNVLDRSEEELKMKNEQLEKLRASS